MKKGKKFGLVQVISEIKKGLNPKSIAEKYNIPKQTLGYTIDKLKKMGCIEKVSYGVWRVIKEVPNRPKDTLRVNSDFSKKEIRGHAFIWTIEFLEGGFNWKQIIENYKKRFKKSRLTFKMICNGKVPRTIFEKRKVWLTKRGLTIYEPLDFFGDSAFRVKGKAVFEMDKLIKSLLKRLGQKIQFYRFNCSREHFAHIKNEMARQFNDEKKKIHVEFDGKNFWIDHSHGEHEEEADNPETSIQAQRYYKSLMKTGFKFTPELIAENLFKMSKSIGDNADNIGTYAKQVVTHVALMKKIDKNLDKQTRFFEDVRNFMLGKKK